MIRPTIDEIVQQHQSLEAQLKQRIKEAEQGDIDISSISDIADHILKASAPG